MSYLILSNDNNFKTLSLEDNVYFTLSDIWLNIDCNDDLLFESCVYQNKLTNNISYSERKEGFKYSNVLSDITYVKSLIKSLKYVRYGSFNYFSEFEEGEEYMIFETWYEQFLDLKNKLDLHLLFLEGQQSEN